MYSITATATTFLANLAALEQRIGVANRQVSSGLRVQTVSDDPASVTDILELQARISANNQMGNNLAKVQTEVNSAESAINTATSVMDRASQIASESANGTTSTATRAQLAGQVQDLLTEVQGLASTQVEGRYVFSGDSDQTAPYGSVNLSANPSNGVGAYQGQSSTRTVLGPNGTSIPIAFTAQDIFDGGVGGTVTTSVFQSLTELYNSLTAPYSQATANQAVTDLSSASGYLSAQQARYGDIQNQISDAVSYQTVLATNLGAQLSAVQDADSAQAAVNLQLDNTDETAAMTAFNSIPKKSLFDYLG